MASNYPNGLDAFSTAHVDNAGEVIHASAVNDNADAVNKIEAELGVNPKGTFSSVAQRLNGGVLSALVQNGQFPQSPVGQGASGRTYCGNHTDGKNWAFNSTGLYQVDTFTSTAWQLKNLPTNVVSTNGVKIIVYNGLMYLLANNTVAAKFEVYSAPLVTGSTQPTWTGPLLQLATNATFNMHNFRATSVGIFVGEYTGASDITGGPSVYRSTDGSTFTNVLQLSTSFTRHIHGVYEDPFNLGTIYVTVGDVAYGAGNPPNYVYKSTSSGASASFSAITALNAGPGAWQPVAMGFSTDYAWFASDQILGGGPYVIDRTAQSPKWASLHHHSTVAVPGGAGRSVVDAVTAASTTLTSATAAFTAADVGRQVSGPNTIPDQTFIQSVTNATTVVMTKAGTGVLSAQSLTIRDTFYMTAYTGATDPISGWFFYVANDASAQQGSVAGVFYLPQPGAVPILLQPIFHANLANYELLIQGGYAWIGRYGPIVLPTKATLP